MDAELSGLHAAVDATPEDPVTKPGVGLGIYSTGFKALGQIEALVRSAPHSHTRSLPRVCV